MIAKLNPKMSVEAFDDGYWYASDLKRFASALGFRGVSRLRKDQLEPLIRDHLVTGELPKSGSGRGGTVARKDPDVLSLQTRIVHYVSNKATKSFIKSEATKIHGAVPTKSGAWYWLNRWREENVAHGITYLDLVNHYIKLCSEPGRLPQIPSARMNNFASDFLAANAGTRQEAMHAWEQLKGLKIPKTFEAWKAHQS
ncbi:MAG: hypothetical protein AAGL69_07330 [Pseudomonadota bacterium]